MRLPRVIIAHANITAITSLSWLSLLHQTRASPGLSLKHCPVQPLLGVFLLDNSQSTGGRQPPAFLHHFLYLSILFPRLQTSLTALFVLDKHDGCLGYRFPPMPVTPSNKNKAGIGPGPGTEWKLQGL